MIKRSIILFLALALPGLAIALFARGHAIPTEPTQFAVAASSSEGRTAISGLFVPNQTIDLGTIAPNGMVYASFKFENKSDKLLEISEVIPECGCTTVMAGKQKIAPGATSLVAVRLDATRAGGSPFRKSILARVNVQSGIGDVHLFLTGTVDSSKQFVVFNNAVDVGDVVAGSEIHRKLLFRGGSNLLDSLPQQIRITLGEDSKLEMKSSDSLPALETRTVDLTIQMPKIIENTFTRLASTLTIVPNNFASQTQTIRISGQITPPIVAEPSEVLLLIRNDEKTSEQISLSSINSVPFTVTNVSSDLPMDCRFAPTGDPTASITVTSRLGSNAKSLLVGYLKVEFDHGLPPLKIRVVLEPRI